MFKTQFEKWLGLGGMALALSACTVDSKSGIRGYISNTNEAWKTTSIKACWTQPQVFESSKLIVSQHVTEQYRLVGLDIHGWQDCTPDDVQSVKVSWDLKEGYSKAGGLGVQEDGKNQTVMIGLGGDYQCSVPLKESNCLANVALHEFGHVIGLHHEMNRTDMSLQDCDLKQMNEPSTLLIGDPDFKSIMNYCGLFALNTTNTKQGFSDGDRAVIHELYFGHIATVATVAGAEVPAYDPLLPVMVPATVDFTIGGQGVTQYKLKVVPWNETDPDANSTCNTKRGWSAAHPISDKVTSALLWPDAPPQMYQKYKICMLGGTIDNTWQNMASYTSFITTVVEHAKLPKVASVVPTVSDGGSTLKIIYGFESPLPLPPTNDSYLQVTNDQIMPGGSLINASNVTKVDDLHYELSYKTDGLKYGEYSLSYLNVNVGLGISFSSSLFVINGTDQPTYSVANIPVIKVNLGAPKINSLVPTIADGGKSLSIVFGFDQPPSKPPTMHTMFEASGGNVPQGKWFLATKITKVDDLHYEFLFATNDLKYAEYSIPVLFLEYDAISGSSYTLRADGDTYYNTTIPVLKLSIGDPALK